ncbi:MAG: 4-hydroxy-tetrahydrodipicolinate synthase [Maribacter sp.]|jgi:4-hydroxy-tetrahydrodipicolinate synthase
MEQLRGTGVALVTPFKEDGTIDVQALSAIVMHCKKGRVDYLVALGTTAESVTLSKEEKQTVLDTIVVANNGELPLVIGLGGNHTMAVVNEFKTLDLSDFCAVLSVSPYYNRPTQEGIYQHFKALSHASPLPIILYNVPGRTGSNMLPATTLRLAKDFKNIIAVKEACGNMVQVFELLQNKPSNFMVLSGDDLTALPTILAGGDGVISVIGQGLPQEFSEMVRLGLDSNAKEAYRYHYLIQEGMHLIFEEGNPAGIKAILELLNLCSAEVRLPLIAASTELKKKIGLFMYSVSKILA